MSRIPHTFYVHRGSDELSDLWPADAPQQDTFHYVGYEIKLTGEVDLATGEFFLHKVQDTPLVEEVKV